MLSHYQPRRLLGHFPAFGQQNHVLSYPPAHALPLSRSLHKYRALRFSAKTFPPFSYHLKSRGIFSRPRLAASCPKTDGITTDAPMQHAVCVRYGVLCALGGCTRHQQPSPGPHHTPLIISWVPVPGYREAPRHESGRLSQTIPRTAPSEPVSNQSTLAAQLCDGGSWGFEHSRIEVRRGLKEEVPILFGDSTRCRGLRAPSSRAANTRRNQLA
jgi:hypothetical protein